MVDVYYDINTHDDTDTNSVGNRLRMKHGEIQPSCDWEYQIVANQDVVTVDTTYSDLMNILGYFAPGLVDIRFNSLSIQSPKPDFTVAYATSPGLLTENTCRAQSPHMTPPVLLIDNDYGTKNHVVISAQALTSHTTKNNPNEDYFSRKKEESFWTKAERNYRRFRDDLVHVFEEFPIEDGITHPADDIIEQAFRDDNHTCRDSLVRGFYEFKDLRPAISAAFLRCTARVDFAEIGVIGLSLAQDALDHNNIEIREAAVRMLENWGGNQAIHILRQHNDTIAWISRYIDQVIVDLSNTTS